MSSWFLHELDEEETAAQAVAFLSLSHLMGSFIQAGYAGLKPPVSSDTSARIRSWAAHQAIKSLGNLTESLEALKNGQGAPEPPAGVKELVIPFGKPAKKPRKIKKSK